MSAAVVEEPRLRGCGLQGSRGQHDEQDGNHIEKKKHCLPPGMQIKRRSSFFGVLNQQQRDATANKPLPPNVAVLQA